jgi:hypothetical protein
MQSTGSLLTESGRPNSAKSSSQTLRNTFEKKAKQIPPSTYLALAGGALALSIGLAMSRRNKGWANFVGNWVPSLLLLGVYNNIWKTEAAAKEEQLSRLH